MKRAILILVSLLSLALGNVLPSLAQHPFYIYRNDGGFNAFYHDDIDSIMYSNYDADSIYHTDIVSQVIYAYDSVFVIPLAAIDSVSFITPETVYKPGVRVIDDLAEYVITSDSLSFVLAYATPQMLLPKMGEKIVTTISTDGFPEGFVGEVLTLENVAEGIKVSCERVAITDIFEVYYGLTLGGEYEEKIFSHRAKSWANSGTLIIKPRKTEIDLRETIAVNYKVLDDVALNFTPDLAFIFEPEWEIRSFLIVNPQIGVYAMVGCTGNYKFEERLGLSGTLQWQKDFPVPFLSRERIPVRPPFLYSYIQLGGFVRADFTGAYKMKWNQHYRQVHLFEYNSKGEQVLKQPSGKPRLVSRSHNVEGLLNGSVTLGGYVEFGITLVDTRIDRVALRGELGFMASGQAVVMKRDFEEANRSTALYEQMRDCGFSINGIFNGTVLAAAGPWRVDWTPLHNKVELWSMKYVPMFKDVKASRKGNAVHCDMTVSGKCLNPLGVGFALLDKDDNLEASGFADYSGLTSDYQYDFENVLPNKKFTLYPIVKAWDYTMLAIPACHIDEAGLPVRITTFEQTGSHYKENGYSYKDKTYSYQYDVTVTIELTNPEGVEDWGYVYEDLWGDTARISLNGFNSPYSDSRYIYYRNENESTVRLYEYVKFEGSEEYEYGEPVDYEVYHGITTCPDDNHPHMIDLGLPSGTKWACCNVGASSPEEYGGYYAWGETEEKDYYDWSTYKYGRYWEDCDYIGSNIAGTQYDVAHVKWGGSWRIPTVEQIHELYNNCSWKWKTNYGVKGQLVTGPNGEKIFLPAAGGVLSIGLFLEGSHGFCWSSIPYPNQSEGSSYHLSFDSAGWGWNNGGNRMNGESVRPVCK